ncbi:MAG: DUF4412 domain-containing protein [Opitutaceae bacterium]
MKTFLRVCLASVLLVPAALSAASFEGKVSMKMTSGRGQPQEITYNIKGNKVRLEMPGQKGMGGMIMDTSKKEMVMIMEEQKAYMVMALPQAAVDAVAKTSDDMTLEKTGETEKILGYTATKYIVTSKDGQSDLWLAEGLGTFMGFNNSNPMGGRRNTPPPAWERALAGKELFPLRVVGKDKGNKESFRMEVTAIDKKTLPDSLFAPPADYKKFDMGGMLKGIIPGAR